VPESKASYQVARQEMSRDDMFRVVKDLEFQMKEAARNLEFEKAAALRDEILELRKLLAAEQKTLSG
jgi:excinuclease ABC subunit B